MKKEMFLVIRTVFNQKVLITSAAWVVFIIMIGWVPVAIGWWLLALLWWHELLVPNSIRTTDLAMLLIVIWGGMVLVFFLGWSKFNYYWYFVKNKQKYELVVPQAPSVTWSEAILDPVNLQLNCSHEVGEALEIVTLRQDGYNNKPGMEQHGG